MRILQLTSHFSPNVGGVETHLSDLVSSLDKRDWKVFVLTYNPLTTKAKWKMYEKTNNISIFRIPWVSGLFYKLTSFPILEFIYLLPGLFIFTPLVILINRPQIIHMHGLIAGAVGVFWGKVFGIRTVISTHSIYGFPKKGLYVKFVKLIFGGSDHLLGLSRQAVSEIKSLGIPQEKVSNFTYWIDMEKFKKIPNAKAKLKWNDKFIVLFVGRLIPEKGIKELLESFILWDKKITLVIAGVGPLGEEVKKYALKNKQILFLGAIDNRSLPLYYSASNLLIVPSVGEEGFGRVVIEALACELPVIGSNRGGIPEAMDSSVGKLIDVTSKNIAQTVNYFYDHPQELELLSKKTRDFAAQRYSEKNAEEIIKSYRTQAQKRW